MYDLTERLAPQAVWDEHEPERRLAAAVVREALEACRQPRHGAKAREQVQNGGVDWALAWLVPDADTFERARARVRERAQASLSEKAE
jgi:hypothetical protein